MCENNMYNVKANEIYSNNRKAAKERNEKAANKCVAKAM